MKILFLIPYPLDESPSQRFRFEQYINILSDNGSKLHFQSFLESHNWQVFFKSGQKTRKALAVAQGFIKRFFLLFSIFRFEYIFIHREATPIGPPIFEWIIAKVLKKRIIYDFDDAIWLTDRRNESIILRILKWRSKVGSICKWSYRISCGNEHLANYARQFNNDVVVNPTTIDTQNLHNPALYQKGNYERITIGWTGSHSTLKYLKIVEPIIANLQAKYPWVSLIVIADGPPELSLPSLIFIPWSKENEMQDLLRIDVGIMPLPDDEWSKGKCGFKALQYMAMEIPTVASPVGVNSFIIESNVNGFLCANQHEWINILEELITNAALRKRIGQKGRERVVNYYSVNSNSSTFVKLFG